MTIAVDAKTTLPLGTRPAGPKVGTPIANPRIMLVGSSYVVGGPGFGDPVGNSYQFALHQYLTSCGITPTWIGNLTRGTPPANKHRGVVGATIPDHMIGGPFDSVQYVATLGPLDLVAIDLQVNDMNDAVLGDPVNFEANYTTLATQFFNAGVPRVLITMMNLAGNDTRKARFPPCWGTYPSIQANIAGTGALVVTADIRMFDNEAQLYDAEVDGSRLHPNEGGYILLAEAFAPYYMNACGYNAQWYGLPAAA